jgi:superfamily II DNA/RNA helicase
MSYNSYHSGARRQSTSYGRKPSYNNNRGPKQRGQYINPALFVRSAKVVEAEAYEPTHVFEDFEVNQLLKDNLVSKGFKVPTPIQDQTIPQALEGKDIIGIANTGTGKTAAFALPILHQLMSRQNARALIIAPTRELAQQIEDECKWIAKGSGLNGVVLIGGTSMGPQLRDLRANPRIVIGTPGRIKDHIEQRSLNLELFNMVVLDEVDRMLDMGFINDVRYILDKVASQRQCFFFSATLDSKVNSLIQSFANDPVTISLKTNEGSENVHQNVVAYNTPHDKLDKLHDILIKNEVEKIIVFDGTQRSVERLSKELVARGFKADAIHGGKSQGQRQRALNRFKNDEVNILVATDVAARGIDVTDITHVINYSTPQSYDDYIHRIGRTGRAGKTGNALTFVTG